MSNGRFDTQDNNPDAWVGIAEGFHRDTNQQVQELIIKGKDPAHHIHLGIDMQGNEVFRNER